LQPSVVHDVSSAVTEFMFRCCCPLPTQGCSLQRSDIIYGAAHNVISAWQTSWLLAFRVPTRFTVSNGEKVSNDKRIMVSNGEKVASREECYRTTCMRASTPVIVRSNTGGGQQQQQQQQQGGRGLHISVLKRAPCLVPSRVLMVASFCR
jgi:hypothetical protein